MKIHVSIQIPDQGSFVTGSLEAVAAPLQRGEEIRREWVVGSTEPMEFNAAPNPCRFRLGQRVKTPGGLKGVIQSRTQTLNELDTYTVVFPDNPCFAPTTVREDDLAAL